MSDNYKLEDADVAIANAVMPELMEKQNGK